MKVRCGKTEYIYVTEGEPSGTAGLKGVQVEKIHEFKYLGSKVHIFLECNNNER